MSMPKDISDHSLPTTYSIVSHTHWDREWYLTHEAFRLRLVDLMERLFGILESIPEYVFHLDAQTVIVEDYLEVFPDRRAALRRYVAEGRIVVGPWYLQNDFYLTSGEATIRNLNVGISSAEELGGSSMVGYTPDQFGLISQLPQLLNGVGIASCVYGRGYRPEQHGSAEFIWRGGADSQVLAIHLPYWYNNAQRFPAEHEDALALFRSIREKLAGISGTRHRLLMNGVDHLEPQEDLLEIVDRLAGELGPGEEIRQERLDAYVERVRGELPADTRQISGELRYGTERELLAGTLSSRSHLKLRNFAAQKMLESVVEPLSVALHQCGGDTRHQASIDLAWKILMQNHPHDSICGCSIDRVHQHMEDRFARVEEICEDLLRRFLDTIAGGIDVSAQSPGEYIVCIFNPTVHLRDGVHRVAVEVPRERGASALRVIDDSGEPVSVEVVTVERRIKEIYSPVNLPGMVETDTWTIDLEVELPPVGYRALRVQVDDGRGGSGGAGEGHAGRSGRWHPRRVSRPDVTALDEGLESLISSGPISAASSPDGSIGLTDHRSGFQSGNLCTFSHEADVGDSYVYGAAPGTVAIQTGARTVVGRSRESARLRESLTVNHELSTPSFYDHREQSEADRSVTTPITVSAAVDRGAPWLDLHVSGDNRARDRRLRLVVETGIEMPTVYAHTPLDLVERSVEAVAQGVAEQPNSGLVILAGQNRSLSIANCGLYEYEIINQSRGVVAFTLVRGTGFIYLDPNDSDHAHGMWPVPGNQCLGAFGATLRIIPHRFGRTELARVVGEAFAAAERLWVPTAATAFPVDRGEFEHTRPFVQEPGVSHRFRVEPELVRRRLAWQRSFLSLESSLPVQLSALKLAYNGPGVVVRLFNPLSVPASTVVRAHHHTGLVRRTNLRETRGEIVGEGGVAEVVLAPKEILTLEFSDEHG